MKRIFIFGIVSMSIICLMMFSIFSTRGFSQAKTYDLTENQKLRLKVQILNFQLAQEHYNQAMGSFNAEIKAVEKENNWPENLQFDANTITLHDPPISLHVPPAPPEPKAKPGTSAK